MGNHLSKYWICSVPTSTSPAPDDGKGFEPIPPENLDLGEIAPDGRSFGSIGCAAWIQNPTGFQRISGLESVYFLNLPIFGEVSGWKVSENSDE